MYLIMLMLMRLPNMICNPTWVVVYVKHVDPTATKPKWSLKHQVTPKLKPILKALSGQYSPIHSKFLNLSHNLIHLFFLELNQHIFVYDDDEWMIKGRYQMTLENDEDITWTYENGQALARILIVSSLFFISTLD